MSLLAHKPKVIVIPLFLPWNRPADFQRQTCRALIQLGYKVIMYDVHHARFFARSKEAKVEERNVEFYQPLFVFPGQRFPWIKVINQRIAFFLFSLKIKSFIFWSFSQESLPYVTTLHRFFKNRTATIYDCVDYFYWPNSPVTFTQAKSVERKYIQLVDFFFTNSKALATLHEGTRIPSAILPPGLDVQTINAVNTMRVVKKPKSVGYIGELGQRIDWKLLNELTKRLPSFSFYLIGNVLLEQLSNDQLQFWGEIQNRKNVHHFSHLQRKDALLKIKQCKICIIPYNSQDINTLSFPMKFIEYLALGKPVMSSPIQELREFSKYCVFPNSLNEWIDAITNSKQYPKVPSSRIQTYSWTSKVSQILHFVAS